MNSSRNVNLNIDIENMEVGSFAMGINNMNHIEPKVQGLLL